MVGFLWPAQVMTNNNMDKIRFKAAQFSWNIMDRIRLLQAPRSCRAEKNEVGNNGKFFFDPEGLKAIRQIYSDSLSSRKDDLIARADKICEHKFDLLGLADLIYGLRGNIDWHLDPVSKNASPKDWWQGVKYIGRKSNVDSKIIWELNRHQHFVLLAQAYVCPGKININWNSSARWNHGLKKTLRNTASTGPAALSYRTGPSPGYGPTTFSEEAKASKKIF